GVGEGPRRARGVDQARAAQRGHPGDHAAGHAAAADPRRHRGHRDDLRAAGGEPIPLRRDQPARLPGDPGREPAGRVHRGPRQPRRGRPLRRARPADPLLSAMTSATLELNGAAPTPAGARPRPAAVRWALAAARFARRKPLGAIGGVIVVAILVMAVFAEQIAPYRFDETIRGARMKPPSAAHWLGTDNLSRDMWSRIVYGARVSVTVGVATVGLAVLLATAVGVSSGYFGGAYDLVVQRVVDAWLSFPYLVIVLSVMAVLGPGLLNVVLSLAVLIAAVNSRVIRGATIAVAQSTYVEAARAL